MNWTDEKLAELPVRSGFRQRGEDMTRIEIFSDAAFAFAVTMLVVSLSSIPKDYAEFMGAMKGIPAFAASFAQIMMFWMGHRKWSRRYGLDDTATTLLTLALIFVVLVYVYPLKLMMSGLFFFFSQGWFPSEFAVDSDYKMTNLIAVYGIGVFLLSSILAGLYWRSHRVSESMKLSKLEVLYTREDQAIWTLQAFAGLSCAVFAWTLPSEIALFGGFVFFMLPIVIPFIAGHFRKKRKLLEG